MQIPDQPACLLKFPVASVTLQFRDCSSCGQATLLTRFPPLFPKVRHRWCELVVKHKYAKAYEQVERFLQEDQAMGVYLYGELMLSEDARQQQLARRCFERVREHMDRASAQVVSEMLF
ncbi:hypothetical protein NN561_015910 [Cricetulus griseus]